jgi:Helicase conserved C-terminal domain
MQGSVHVENRRKILKSLVLELVGPFKRGDDDDFYRKDVEGRIEEIDCTSEIEFSEKPGFYKPKCQKGSNEEILQRDIPVKRYGIGVLYPSGILLEEETEQTEQTEPLFDSSGEKESNDFLSEKAKKELEEIDKRVTTGRDTSDADDFALSSANAYKQSSMGVSFLANLPEGSVLFIKANGGRYRPKKVTCGNKEFLWWLRSPVRIECDVPANLIYKNDRKGFTAGVRLSENLDGLDIRLEVFARKHSNNNDYLITICMVNRKQSNKILNEDCLFQAHFEVYCKDPSDQDCILPYPGPPFENLDNEEKSLLLLYLESETYAIGHGCAANWELPSHRGKASKVSAECLPFFESPSITPEISRPDDTKLEVSMACLAGLIEGDNGFNGLREVVALYEDWIKEQRARIPSIDVKLHATASRHLVDCERCASRMHEGLKFLASDPKALQAFQLANHAILLQQLQSRRDTRLADYDRTAKRIIFQGEYIPPGVAKITDRGKWRAFQIAFLLMSIKSTALGKAEDRKTVELIWFPTGGGKTEAYLGLTAFGLFYRRLNNPDDHGVHVLMRYTLRLLTAQQFQRASGLLCAMEYLRRKGTENLGTNVFSIGIWLGGDTTPNSNDAAMRIYNGLRKGDKYTENLLLVTKCPWCGAQMGPFKHNLGGQVPRVLGYVPSSGTVIFKCPDQKCDFRDGLPVYVVDEEIYKKRPSLIIGTVDKFAMLAWKPEARSIFGFNNNGERDVSPPGLIIQDELHLISGPLGSMVGLYEAVIEDLCTDYRTASPERPKIVCSTATIRRFSKQVNDLYARDDVVLFPPPGLDVSDSFFARYARGEHDELMPGRIYVGIHAPGLGSLQTVQVRTFTALLQSPVELSKDERDPWWTLLLFFNSLRELGTTLSLFQSDIPDYFGVIQSRHGLDYKEIRRISNLQELTGRIRSDEVPEKISELEVTTNTTKQSPVDVCLASNIIEVGIDIDRLSLMAVVGQPKTTAQYIQVTGRIGRKWWERPGFVATIYTASKPRDRSHFEKFKSYHQRLYAQVEPTSLTPFSPPTLDRALHAVMSAYVRQGGNAQNAYSPYPFPENHVRELVRILTERIKFVDNAELPHLNKMLKKRESEWKAWKRTVWDSYTGNDEALLRTAGAYVSNELKRVSWPTPMSMRNVDAECQAEITTLYCHEGEEDYA